MGWSSFVSCLFLITIIITIELWVIKNVYKDFKHTLKEKVAYVDLAKLKFDSYLKVFNKSYSREEYGRRFENFKASIKDIVRLNAIEGSRVFGLTKFSDMSKEEFANRMLLRSIPPCTPREFECDTSQTSNETLISNKYGDDIPALFDWRTEGVVKPVLNQKRCQGCWAFSIVGVLETMSAIQKLDSKSRSIQELLDCSTYNNGCTNGSVIGAMEYICHNHLQIVTEEEYPMTLSMDQVCKLPARYSGRTVKRFKHQCRVDESLMVQAIVRHGPLIVAVDASNWRNYLGDGVIHRACLAGISNHVVQIVGYDTNSSTPYYIVKNSFGEDFGDHGYAKIAMYENICGIADQVTVMDVI